MEKTWKPTVAGILVIVLGALSVVGGAIVVIPIVKDLIVNKELSTSSAFALLLLPWALSALFVGIVAVAGGICAVRRKTWGLALAGAVFALPAGLVFGLLLPVRFTPALCVGAVLGVLAIVFVIMGRREFERRAKPMAGTGFCPACGAPTATQTEICANCRSKRTEAVRPRTWKPKVAGILSIVAGIVSIIARLILVTPSVDPASIGFLLIDFLGVGLLVLLIGIVAIVGGISALRRRSWGLALAGCICALPAWVIPGGFVPAGHTPALLLGAVLGVLAIIFVIMGRREFERRAKPMAGAGFCPACGAPTATQTEICANCGAKLTGVAEQRTWKPKMGGILAIVAGVLTVIVGIALVTTGADLALLGFLLFAFAGLGLLAVLIGIVAVVGGICALRRRSWGLALAGSICAIPAGVVLGVLAIIFIIRGKSEFR
jgi:hypothetical protein